MNPSTTPPLSPHTTPMAALTDRAWWEQVYADRPRWDIGRPQPAFARLAEAGAWSGRVLDVGCGTGEHVLLAARLGLDATGIDIADAPLHIALAKAAERGLSARFLRRDVRTLTVLRETFDTVLDCGLFHIFTSADRDAYLEGLRAVTRPNGRLFLLCFAGPQPGTPDRRLDATSLSERFRNGWRTDSIQAATLDSRTDAAGIPALLLTATRT
jgi:SAM-dependent methyltransferase